MLFLHSTFRFRIPLSVLKIKELEESVDTLAKQLLFEVYCTIFHFCLAKLKQSKRMLNGYILRHVKFNFWFSKLDCSRADWKACQMALFRGRLGHLPNNIVGIVIAFRALHGVLVLLFFLLKDGWEIEGGWWGYCTWAVGQTPLVHLWWVMGVHEWVMSDGCWDDNESLVIVVPLSTWIQQKSRGQNACLRPGGHSPH